MNKYLIAALVAFILTAVGLAQYKDVVISPRITKTSIQAPGDAFVGTGFFVQDQVILTANHVIAGYRQLTVLYRGRWYPATVISKDVTHDLALLRINTGSFTPYAVIMGLRDHEIVQTRAYDLGSFTVSQHRLIVDLSIPMGGLTPVRGEICEGNSGSPAFDSANRVVGVTDRNSTAKTDTYGEREGCSKVGWLVLPQDIQDFLARSNIISNTSKSTINIVYIENQT